MQLVGLGNTRILTDYAQKSPWTLNQSSGPNVLSYLVGRPKGYKLHKLDGS